MFLNLNDPRLHQSPFAHVEAEGLALHVLHVLPHLLEQQEDGFGRPGHGAGTWRYLTIHINQPLARCQ